ncbi:hypothetical protein SISSUDRAFT_93822 [Sistotremastrum suecicum HHB10207 ss-3]|uniref:Uncharacterized protein n=1 Tax=Sistotremastrum suecicum HHB10207 ss-3 TaxID=1314776 RepID=A0A166B7U3_9AGAM|nr:hypothetical protein SISSUDRAFT_93822 [Sistotremastrum suecicum HHB10207 ss-3]
MTPERLFCRRRLKRTMSAFIHSLSSSFQSCACGPSRDCALYQMTAFVEDRESPPPTPTSRKPKPNLGPLVGVQRGVTTKENGKGGATLMRNGEPVEEEVPDDIRAREQRRLEKMPMHLVGGHSMQRNGNHSHTSNLSAATSPPRSATVTPSPIIRQMPLVTVQPASSPMRSTSDLPRRVDGSHLRSPTPEVNGSRPHVTPKPTTTSAKGVQASPFPNSPAVLVKPVPDIAPPSQSATTIRKSTPGMETLPPKMRKQWMKEKAETLRVAREKQEAAIAEAEAEAKRKLEAEAEVKRKLEEEAEAKRKLEAEAAEAEAKKRAEEEEARQRAEEEEAMRIAAEEEARRIAAEEEARKIAEEAEARRKAEEEDARRRAEEEERARKVAEELRLQEEERIRVEIEQRAKEEQERIERERVQAEADARELAERQAAAERERRMALEAQREEEEKRRLFEIVQAQEKARQEAIERERARQQEAERIRLEAEVAAAKRLETQTQKSQKAEEALEEGEVEADVMDVDDRSVVNGVNNHGGQNAPLQRCKSSPVRHPERSLTVAAIAPSPLPISTHPPTPKIQASGHDYRRFSLASLLRDELDVDMAGPDVNPSKAPRAVSTTIPHKRVPTRLEGSGSASPSTHDDGVRHTASPAPKSPTKAVHSPSPITSSRSPDGYFPNTLDQAISSPDVVNPLISPSSATRDAEAESVSSPAPRRAKTSFAEWKKRRAQTLPTPTGTHPPEEVEHHTEEVQGLGITIAPSETSQTAVVSPSDHPPVEKIPAMVPPLRSAPIPPSSPSLAKSATPPTSTPLAASNHVIMPSSASSVLDQNVAAPQPELNPVSSSHVPPQKVPFDVIPKSESPQPVLSDAVPQTIGLPSRLKDDPVFRQFLAAKAAPQPNHTRDGAIDQPSSGVASLPPGFSKSSDSIISHDHHVEPSSHSPRLSHSHPGSSSNPPAWDPNPVSPGGWMSSLPTKHAPSLQDLLKTMPTVSSMISSANALSTPTPEPTTPPFSKLIDKTRDAAEDGEIIANSPPRQHITPDLFRYGKGLNRPRSPPTGPRSSKMAMPPKLNSTPAKPPPSGPRALRLAASSSGLPPPPVGPPTTPGYRRPPPLTPPNWSRPFGERETERDREKDRERDRDRNRRW